jgi:hypothetical protein
MDPEVPTAAAAISRLLRKSTLSVSEGIACLTMTDAPSRNAMTQDLKDDLEEVVR